MIKFYFKLQFKRLQRMLFDFKINPYLGLILGIIIFLSFSKYLFYKSGYSNWIYALIGLMVLSKLGEKDRTENLISTFIKKVYYRIRILENTIFVFPFLLYLLYEKSYLTMLLLALLSILMAFLKFKYIRSFTIPTPFRKFPFEFIIGFRKTFLLYIFSYFLCVIAIKVDNFNLGVFSLLSIYLISILHYFKPENPYFVWIYSVDSKTFLQKKIISAIICSLILVLPNLIALLVFFNRSYLLLIGIIIFGLIILISTVLAKYSAFPYEMNLPQGMLYALGFWLPPMFLAIIPIFYMQSKRNLEDILDDNN